MNHNYFDLGGTFRSRLSQETLDWIQPVLPKIGVTRLANVTGLDTIGIPTFICIRPNAKHLSVSQGKGVTADLAKISALMESIEVFHAENPPTPELYGSFQKLLSTHQLIGPEVFVSGFFKNDNHHDKNIAWKKAIDLVTLKPCYIPHSLVTLDSSLLRAEHGFVSVTSNGLASGNCIDEAVCHGLYEVIERDAVARWNALDESAKQITQINLKTITNPILQDLVKRYQDADVLLTAWDVTSEIGVPSFNCAIQDQNALRNLGRFVGSGSHLSKEVALARALTEAAQSRLTYISGSRDDVFPERYLARASGDQNNALKEGDKNFADCIQPGYHPTFAASLDMTVSKLCAANFNKIFVVDHTKHEIGVPVVQVFVPGLRFA